MNVINSNRSILNNVVVGYTNTEPCFITSLALKENLFIIGAHGNGKTTLGKTLSMASDPSGDGFRYFSADKAGLINIGGLPDMEQSRVNGELSFIPNNNTIFGANVVVVDELPRATSELQNYWMEVLEEGTFQGKPTSHDMIIATGNDKTYSGNFKFDLALLSRFLFVVPAPSFTDISADEVVDMVKLNSRGGRDTSTVASSIQDLIGRMRVKIDEFWQDRDLLDQLEQFIGAFTQFVLDKVGSNRELADNPDAYFSPREYAHHMIHGLIGLYAYFTEMGVPRPLFHAGQYAVRYIVEQRHVGAGEAFVQICNTAWRQLAGMLTDNIQTPAGKLNWKFATALTAPAKVGFWRNNLPQIESTIDVAESTVMASETLRQIHNESPGQIAPFYSIMRSSTHFKHIAMEVEGLIATEVTRKLLLGKADPNRLEHRLWNQFHNALSLTQSHVAQIMDVQNDS